MAKNKSQSGAWDELYDEFKTLYPRLKDKIVGFSPADEVSIFIHFTGGTRMIFDGIQHRAKIVN